VRLVFRIAAFHATWNGCPGKLRPRYRGWRCARLRYALRLGLLWLGLFD